MEEENNFNSPHFITIGDLDESGSYIDGNCIDNTSINSIPENDIIIKGRILRERNGCNLSFSYISEECDLRITAIKKLFKYKIYCNDEYIATLKSNLYGSRYKLIVENIEELIIEYDAGIFRKKGPRHFKIIYSIENNKCLAKDWQNRNYEKLIVMKNKNPIYSPETNSYVLNFNGRVTQPSVKNFQIVHPKDITNITLTFGRTDNNSFVLDYSFPWSAVKAFAIALTALDFKIGCE